MRANAFTQMHICPYNAKDTHSCTNALMQKVLLVGVIPGETQTHLHVFSSHFMHNLPIGERNQLNNNNNRNGSNINNEKRKEDESML